MKKVILCLLSLMFFLMLYSIDENVLSLVGKVLRFYGDNGVVNGFEVVEQDNHKIDVMLFKSFRTGKVERINITGVDFNNFSNVGVIENNEAEYLAKIEQEKQDNQKKSQEQENYYENANKSAKGNPFALFMGMPWKTNAVDFKTNFKHTLIPFTYGFIITNFPLRNINIKTIAFVFQSQDKTLKFTNSNYAKFYFNQVFMTIEPSQFESLLDVFIKKYGKPFDLKEYEIHNRMGAKFNQKEIHWKNGDRKIKLSRYTETIDEGRISFSPVQDDKQFQKEMEKETKEAADIL